MSGVSWPVERVRGGAGALHARGVPAVPFGRLVEVMEPDRPALVLGSTQPESVADAGACARARVEVARRRSGGGAVLVDPPSTLWVDVLLPAGDGLWSDDVSRSSHWLGSVWAAALEDVDALPAAGPVVHDGAICMTRWGRLVCFAGLGPGEVTAGAGGPKVVGISQRRGRFGARFQCAVVFEWDAPRLTALLAFPTPQERGEAAAALSAPSIVRPVDAHLRDALLASFLAHLPA